VFLVTFALIFGTTFFFTSGWSGLAISLVAAFITGLPFIFAGMLRLRRCDNLLNTQSNAANLISENREAQGVLPSASRTDGLEAEISIPNTVTENTTLKLRPPVPKR